MINIMFAGVGGQGTVLASKLIATAAINKGLNVRTTETIGMAQRGGSVVSHVRIGEVIHSPLIPLKKADALVCFEPAEAVRCFDYLKPNGILLACTNPIIPITNPNYNGQEAIAFLKENVINLELFDINSLSNPKTLNIAMIGLLLKHKLVPCSLDEMKKIIKQKLPAKLIEMNIKALEASL